MTEADDARHWRSAYIHVPFCRRRCPYCDFAVVTPDEGGTTGTIERYLAAVVAEIERSDDWGPLDAVNLGGGTPSALSAAGLGRLLDALRRRFGLADRAEVSLEVNPEDWTEDTAAGVVAAGFTRASFGVQSFDDDILAALGRAHTARQAVAALRHAARSGLESVAVDLIYGTPGESAESWRRSVETALSLHPDHLSAYALTVERGTALSRAVAAGAPAPDPDDQADKYDVLADLAPQAGLIRYEVSNHARPGHQCRYNAATWAQGDYLGFGLGAHGHRNAVRTRNLRRLDRYLEAIESGRAPVAGREHVTGWRREQERLMLGLRRAAGVTAGTAGERLLAGDPGRRLVAAGVLDVAGDRLVVARPLLTDAVVRAVLDLDPPDDVT